MVEGTRVECIIGATRIRDFSTATEVGKSSLNVFGLGVLHAFNLVFAW